MKHVSLLLLVCGLGLGMGCGTHSKTGEPGPMGQPYLGEIEYLSIATPDGPADYVKELEAVKAAVKAAKPEKHTRAFEVMDDGKAIATVEAVWKTVKVGDKVVFTSITPRAVKYAENYSCRTDTLGPPVSGFGINVYEAVAWTFTCDMVSGNASSVISRTVLFGDGKGGDRVLFNPGPDALQ